MGSRTWIKIYCDKWLNGTIREETPEVRGIWVDLLVLAGSGKYGDSGEIKITDLVGFLDQQLADLLQISVQKWVACKKKLIETDRLELQTGNIIVIKNWSKYQSEYRRQRQYHHVSAMSEASLPKCNKILQPDITTDFVTNSTARDRDKRLEKENRDTPLNPPTVLLPSEINQNKVLDAFRANILKDSEATLTEQMEKELTGACARWSPQWVYEAIREAVVQGHAYWAYIIGILRNREKDGKR